MWRYFVLSLPFFAFNAVLPFVAGLAPGYFGWLGYTQDQRLREQGILVEAHITAKTKIDSAYHIKYSFIDMAGKEWTAERDLGDEYNEMVNMNDYFLITYLPSNPKIHIIGDRSSQNANSTLAIGLIAIAVLFWFWGALGLGYSFWRLYRIRDLFRNGAEATAVVGDWINAPERADKRKDRMTFHFVAMNGRWYEGRSRGFGSHLRNRWPKGSHIKVVYDRANPIVSEPDVFRILRSSKSETDTGGDLRLP
jgi:hypothetical protein